ncbi:hypothetical protein S83_067392, partial [Arachis hypogaea]
SPSKVFKVFGSNSKTLNQQSSASNNLLLLCCIEKAKTDLSIAKKRRTDSLAPINIPGLELPSWVQVCFRPTTSMGLDDTELEIAAYLYGNYLMDNYEEDIVFSELTARRDVFRSLMPGKPIISLVLDLVADMMKTELTRESDRSFYDFETTPNLISSQFEFEEPEGLPTLEAGSNDAGVRVASWMIACVEDDHFNIKVDDGVRMKIAVSLVSKNHNMISYRVKRNAIENLNKLYDNHH